MINARPYAPLNYRAVAGKTMAYIDEGEGDAIVFQHGNPTSSYLWRNVMPHLEGFGRLIACDLIGMGASQKLTPSDAQRYHYAEQREYLFALWDALDLGDRVILVGHDWGAVLAFDWAHQHPDRVQGIAYMEAVTAMDWSDFRVGPDQVFKRLRSPEGEQLVLEQNAFVEQLLPGGVLRELTEAEMLHYRRPFLNPGEDRRPTLSWPRNLPIGGEPAIVAETEHSYSTWLAGSDLPKLFIKADPGLMTNRLSRNVSEWRSQTEVTVAGNHFIQEDAPDEIGLAIADFVTRLREPREMA
jgi:haloalkane dehalogenase